MEKPNFVGRDFYTMDAKNRLAIPAKMRLSISGKKELILSRGLEGCLNLYPLNIWLDLNEKLESMPIKNKTEQRAFKRMFYANACEVDFDDEGRILIPQHLVDYAQLRKEVAIVGLVKKIEIWAKHLWLLYERKQQTVFKRLASRFET